MVIHIGLFFRINNHKIVGQINMTCQMIFDRAAQICQYEDIQSSTKANEPKVQWLTKTE